MEELPAQARRWRGEALGAAGQRDQAIEELSLASQAAAGIGRVRLEWEVASALARFGGGAPHQARAGALAAQIEKSLKGTETEVAFPPAANSK